MLGCTRKAPASQLERTGGGGDVLAEADVIGDSASGASGAAELAAEDFSPLAFWPDSWDERARTTANPNTLRATAHPIRIGFRRALGDDRARRSLTVGG